MQKTIAIGLFSVLPILGQADQVATSASMSVLQAQLNQLNQQIKAAQQSLTTVSQSFQAMQGQSQILKQQIAQYGNTNAKQFKWVDVSDHQIPAHAFVAVENMGKPLYICQALYSNSNGSGYPLNNSIMIPGVVMPKGCVITYSGQAYLQPDYAVLTSNVTGAWIAGDQVKNASQNRPIYRWGPALDSSMMGPGPVMPESRSQPEPLYNALALVGGQDNGSDTYICRSNINGLYFVGKGANNTCFIAVGAYEANWPIYQILLTRQP
ncbi:MAG: hypothetical protein NTV32_03160 [Gammaproteobacteria bacterium]|nr:hypothetical protein [Gammaproteobacteria bacterium]